VKPVVHPNWLKNPVRITEGYSLEITAKDIAALAEVAPRIWQEAPIAIPFLPGENNTARIDAAKAVRTMGFEPMPHFSARRIESFAEFAAYLKAAIKEAGVQRCFVVADDPSIPAGPFADTSSLIATGAFEAAGIKVIGIGGCRLEPLRMVGYPIPRKADLACSDIWEPSLKAFEQLTVEHGTSDLQK
jgi:methylenetetrahydrofolate reductase (NADPH)